ncbi:hypothetical protein ATANTOWER_005278 [Ataeniobius toweri]|uniref:Protein KASH5 n=1 Tax=Ataeniobius toweri TaxID=208326 RepID=A0ABU7AV52_9TELE|nr:hypothetical protein [Ataeniobius toweri]
MSVSHDVPGSHSCGTWDVLRDSKDTKGFSEHELLDIMFNTCDTSNTGEVLASCIMQYLQTLTAHSAEEDRLASLRQLLDPDLQDPHVSRETFQSTMRLWIAQYSQDRWDLPFSEINAAPPEGLHCPCEREDLSGIVADLKRARHQLSEQNSSLLKMLAQCEDENLQLSLEITELQTKLLSAQRSSLKARSVTEELEETRQTLKEVQETASLNQRSFTQLTNATERLRVHIRVLEDKNEKLTIEMVCAEKTVNKLKRVNTELRAEHEEILTLMMLKDKEITKKNILMDKIKNFHVENHKMVESIHSLNPPNQRSLQSEMQDMQQELYTVQGDSSVPVVRSHSGDIQCILHRIKSDETSEHLHSKCPEKDRPFPFRQQQQAALRQQLPKGHHRSVWEEKGEKDKKKQRAWEKEQKQSQTGSQSQMQEAKTVGKVKGEEAANCREQAKVLQEHLKTQAKLLHTEDVISDMKKKVCHLQASLKSGQDCADQKHTSQVPHFHTGHEKERQEAGTTVDKVVRDQADVAVVAEPEKISASEPKQTEQQSTTGGLLVTLKRIEAMVSSALGTAELVRQSERRVSQVREKMESITQKVEKALGRAANTDELLKIIEERPSQVCHPEKFGLDLGSAHPETGTIPFLDDVGPEQNASTELPASSPVFPQVTEPPQLPMNGMVTASQKYVDGVIMVAQDEVAAGREAVSQLPGVKERLLLLLKKARERRGREKEGEALRTESFLGKTLTVTAWLWEVGLSWRDQLELQQCSGGLRK